MPVWIIHVARNEYASNKLFVLCFKDSSLFLFCIYFLNMYVIPLSKISIIFEKVL